MTRLLLVLALARLRHRKNQILASTGSIMRALAHPRLGPLAAVRSSSDSPQRPAPVLLRPPLPFPAARLRRLPELSPPATRHRRPMPPPTATAASGDAAGGGSFPELTCPADFAAVASPGGRISVVGFGSLLSGERSAARGRAGSGFPWSLSPGRPDADWWQSGARGARSRTWRASAWRR